MPTKGGEGKETHRASPIKTSSASSSEDAMVQLSTGDLFQFRQEGEVG
jgi:hypothetical protein